MQTACHLQIELATSIQMFMHTMLMLRMYERYRERVEIRVENVEGNCQSEIENWLECIK